RGTAEEPQDVHVAGRVGGAGRRTKKIMTARPANARAIPADCQRPMRSFRSGTAKIAMNAGAEGMINAAVPALTFGSVSPRFRKRWYPVNPKKARMTSIGISFLAGGFRIWRVNRR